ncbi:MFS transporter [Klebsiella pneumoniae]|uniref:MFS transporter n=1 Tax=Klebsiella pneumoniae TaxID=573 RepID=UPI00224BA551|nr:MFS transporter [Klebsiella pneumoniae]
MCTHSSPFLFAKTDAPSSATVANTLGASHSAFSLKLAWNCSDSQNCGFVTVCYWRFLHLRCFDNGFANFFTSFFATGERNFAGYLAT